jgi:WD40 repeat protein
MARDHEDRYTTAGELAADLQRLLDDEPILAKPPGPIDLARRWMRRHRAMVFTAAATLLIAVVVAGALLWNERSQTLAAYSAEKEQHKIAQRNEAEAHRQAAAADIARAAEAEARGAADREKERALRAQTEAELAQKRAEREAESARESERFARHLAYAGDVRLAAHAWEEGDVRHYTDLLDRLRQREEDLCGFEWSYLRQLGSADYRSIAEGTGGTSSVRYSPDGSLVVTGQYDGSIRVLDTHSCKVLAKCQAHEGLVRCIDFSSDGDHMASTGDDGMIQVWHIPDCRPIAAFPACRGIGFAVFFALDDRILVSCGEEPNAQLWDSESGEKLGALTTDVSELRTLTVSSDGKYCAGSGDGITFIWDLQERRRISRHQGAFMRCLQFSPDGNYVAAGTNDQRIHMFSFQTGEIVAKMEGHGDDIDGLAFHPAGGLLASADRAGVIRTWVLGNGETVEGHKDNRLSEATDSISGWPSCFRAHSARAWSLDFSPEGNHLLSGSKDGTVRAWNRRPPLLRRLQETGEVMGVAFTKTGDELFICQPDKVRVWNRSNNEQRTVGVDIAEQKLSMMIAPDDAMVVLGDSDGSIHLWNRKEGRAIKSFTGHEDDVDRIDISPSGELMVTASWDGTAKLWDFESHEELAVFRVPPHCNDAVFSPDGKLLAISSEDNAMLYDVSSKQCLHLLLGHQNTADCLAFSPDGRLLATGSHDRTIRLWDVETGEIRHVIPAHREKITAVAFSPDGRTVVSGDRKGTIAFSHVETGRFLYDLQIATGATRDLEFATDGEVLAAAIGDQVVLLQISRVPIDSTAAIRKPSANSESHLQTTSYVPTGPDERLATFTVR